MKQVLTSVVLMLASLMIGLVLCEAAIRLVAPQRLDFSRPMYDPDDDLVFKLRKNLRGFSAQYEFRVVEDTNSLGLRDREIGAKPPATCRILGLGDSFSFGYGVNGEETFFKRLESRIRTVTGRPVEVINGGVPAYSLIQEIGFLKKYGMALQPDAVLVGFYVGNDFIDSYELYDAQGQPTIYVADGQLFSRKTRDAGQGLRRVSAPVRRFLATHSHLYIFLRNRFSEALTRVGLRHAPPPPEFCAKEFGPTMRQGWDLTQRLLLELAAFTRQHDLRLIVVVLPAIYQVHDQAWTRYLSTFNLDPARYDLDRPQKLLADFCVPHQIECVDVLPAMRKAGQNSLLFYQVDGHMNRAGHDVVAQVLCDYLSRQRSCGMEEGN